MEEKRYPIVEHFYTVQGEGVWSGFAAYFVRLAGCDVGCSWCDTKYSWDREGFPLLSSTELTALVTESGAKRAVITGGEPTLHDLEDLTAEMRKQGVYTQIETSGAHRPSGQFDWVTLSPKRFKLPVPEFYSLADELKIVVVSRKDLDWALELGEKCRPGTKQTLQPEWNTSAKATPWIVEFIKDHPDWQISIQLHKILQIP